MTREVAVAGVGCTRIGELWSKSLKDLLVEASLKALDDCSATTVDAVYAANAASTMLQGQGSLAALVADQLNIKPSIEVTVEAASASAGVALNEAVKAVAKGSADTVLVIGGEKMSDAKQPDLLWTELRGEDQDYLRYLGANYIGLEALMTRLYLQKFEAPEEHLAAFPVMAHKHSANNPDAQFRNIIDIQDVLDSRFVADPLRMLECASFSDGAAALVLMPLEKVESVMTKPIVVRASTVAMDHTPLAHRVTPLSFKATVDAASNAFKQAGIALGDVNVVEVQDTTAFTGVVALEDLGFVEKGRGADFVFKNEIALDGKRPTNTRGGLKGRGYPPSATGIYQIIDLALQLRGEAGANQVANATIGLAQNMSAMGSATAVTILERI